MGKRYTIGFKRRVMEYGGKSYELDGRYWYWRLTEGGEKSLIIDCEEEIERIVYKLGSFIENWLNQFRMRSQI